MSGLSRNKRGARIIAIELAPSLNNRIVGQLDVKQSIFIRCFVPFEDCQAKTNGIEGTTELGRRDDFRVKTRESEREREI